MSAHHYNSCKAGEAIQAAAWGIYPWLRYLVLRRERICPSER